jgi:hypothetical protein
LQRGASPAEMLEAINDLKTQAFSLYREGLDGISEGLYRITDPDELMQTVSQRLKEAHGDFLNKSPTGVSFTNVVASLPENTATNVRIKVADIVITDDEFGINQISLTGPDAASFEIDGSELFLRQGVALDFESKSSYSVTVAAVDDSLPTASPVEEIFTLAVNDVRELQRPQLRPTTTIRVDASVVGPMPIILTHADLAVAAIADPTTTALVVTSVASGRVEKWDGKSWHDISTPPANSSPQELLRRLAFRVVRPGDLIRWVPATQLGRLTNAFALLGWDGVSLSDDDSDVVFASRA